MKTAECPSCGNEYEKIGNHWHQSDCDYPAISQHQREVLTGLLMGDGWVERADNSKACIRANMITKKYLEYLEDLMGVLGLGVSFYRSAEELVKQSKETGFNNKATVEAYSDQYTWSTRRAPSLNQFAQWYGDNGKVWPSNISLTPTVLKHWYVGDGFFRTTQTNNHIGIAMANERKNKEKVERMFMMGPGVKVSRWDENYREDTDSWYCGAIFSVEDSYKLFDYMGKPLPGFEYKWP